MGLFAGMVMVVCVFVVVTISEVGEIGEWVCIGRLFTCMAVCVLVVLVTSEIGVAWEDAEGMSSVVVSIVETMDDE